MRHEVPQPLAGVRLAGVLVDPADGSGEAEARPRQRTVAGRGARRRLPRHHVRLQESVDALAPSLEPLHDRLRQDVAEPLHPGDLLGFQGEQLFQAAHAVVDEHLHPLAREAGDIQAGDEAIERRPASFSDVLDEFRRQGLSHALERQERLDGQGIEVDRLLDQALVDEDADPLLAEGIDVELHDPAEEVPVRLARALGIGTDEKLPFPLDRLVAGGAVLRSTGDLAAPGLRDPHHLGDDVATPLDVDLVSEAHVEVPDVIGVVESGVGDRHSRDGHRLQACHRGHSRSDPQRPVDALQGRDLALRRELVSRGETRPVVTHPELLL